MATRLPVAYLSDPCIGCGKRSALSLDAAAFDAWRAGALIQQAFPSLTADEREMIKTGTHGDCWDKIFA